MTNILHVDVTLWVSCKILFATGGRLVQQLPSLVWTFELPDWEAIRTAQYDDVTIC